MKPGPGGLPSPRGPHQQLSAKRMVQDMSTTIHVRGPFQFAAEHVAGDGGGFPAVRVAAPGARVTLIRLSRLECDTAIAAFTAARDMLPEDTEGAP
jgi:hypothetical protein